MPDRPAEGELRIARVRCEQMALPLGDRSYDDLWVANARFRAVLRHPLASLTLAGLDGGTAIDLAPWGFIDALHEAAPLVGGGWLAIDEVELVEDGLVMRGTVASLPDQPAHAEGESAEVRWRFEPDTGWIELDGADGLWLHAAGEHAVLDGWAWTLEGPVYGHDGVVEQDLGGALRIRDLTRMFVGTRSEALEALSEGVGTQHLSGTAAGAEGIELARQGVVTGFILASEGVFDATIPADIEAVRAVSSYQASSLWAPPGEDIELFLGGTGAFELRPAWPDDRPRTLQVSWTATDGRKGVEHLPGRGGTLFLGRGEYRLVVAAGPSFRSAPVLVEVEPGFAPVIGVTMERRYDPGSWAPGVVRWPTDRSRTWRGHAHDSANLAHGSGHDWVVFAPEDDVAAAVDTSIQFPPIAHENGSQTLARDGSWSIVSWPWQQDVAASGRGAIDTRTLGPEDALAAVVAGARDRHTVVDLGWLELASSPWAVDPLPEAVALFPPGALGPAAWSAWYRWLDAAIPLAPTGPLTWFEVADPTNLTSQDVAQALVAGRTQATTGPLFELDVLGAGPGDVASGPEVLVRLALGGAEDVDHVALVGEGGVVLHSWRPTEDQWSAPARVTPGGWLIAAAWDDAGTAFAATAPVWVDPPGATQPE